MVMVSYHDIHLRIFLHTLFEFWYVELVVNIIENCPCAHNTGGSVDEYRPRVVLWWIDSQVLLSWMLVKGEQLLCFLILEPHKLYFHAPWLLSLDCAVNNSDRCAVTNMHWCRWLRVSKLLECNLNYLCLFSFKKRAPSSASTAADATSFKNCA